MSKPSGIVFYRGPSMLDGQPIVAILTGIVKRSRNGKTGSGLYQTWILRADLDPLKAVRLGHDFSICGNCKHRGRIVKAASGRRKNVERKCYVRLDTAPLNIWNTWKRGRYPDMPPAEARQLLAGPVRGGSYGDPAAVPFHVWRVLLAGLDTGTAYTHQWKHFPELASFCMASVDTPAEREDAKALGFRTFRVRGQDEPREAYESVCPASKEAGKRTTCDLCKACGGHQAKAKADIVIMAHGGIGKERLFQ
jgi:hypothetical protein